MTTKAIAVAIAATFIAAMLFGQATNSNPEPEWVMLSQNVAVGAAGGQWPGGGNVASAEVYLYNKRTGTAYIRGTCTRGGAESPCFFRMVISDERDDWYTTPMPTQENGVSPY